MKNINFLFGLILLLVFSSCSIETKEDEKNLVLYGNGVYTIETPKENEEISDYIKLSGTWSSESPITKIEIELKTDKEGEITLYNYYADIKNESNIKGSWSKNIDINKDDIRNGSYILKVSFFENNKLVAVLNRSIKLKKQGLIAPSGIIEKPTNDAILKGTFEVTGKIESISLAKVEIYLELIESDQHNGEKKFDAIIEKEKDGYSYHCTIDTLGVDNLQDGEYILKVVLYDKENHITTITRLITIDNTAPIIVLERPSSKQGDTKYDIYGQKLRFSGQIYDDNGIEKIIFRFYDSQNNLVCKVTKNNPELTLDVEIAKYEDSVHNEYAKIYGSLDKTNGLSDPIYYTLEIFDKAGNSTNKFYLYRDLVEFLYNYRITDLHRILGNQKVKGITEEQATNIKLELGSKIVNKGVFHLNPLNNPTFTLKGYREIKNEADFSDPTCNININIGNIYADIATGLDYYELKPESLKVGICEIISGDSMEFLNSLRENNFTVDENKVMLENISRAGLDFRANVKFNQSNMEDGKKYIVRILGEDIMGNRILPKDGIGYLVYKPTSKP